MTDDHISEDVTAFSDQHGGRITGAPPQEQVMTVNRTRIGDAVVVSVTGEIDLLTAPRLQAETTWALDQPGPGPVIIDLTEVTFLASAGLGALVAAAHAATSRREPLRVVVDHQRPVIRPLQASGLDEVLALFHELRGALHPKPSSEPIS